MEFRLEHHRKPFKSPKHDLEPSERRQLEKLLHGEQGSSLDEQIEAEDWSEWKELELIDVIDAASDDVAYQFYLWPYGSGALFEAGSTKEVAVVCQHGFELLEDKGESFTAALARAWRAAKGRLSIEETVDFGSEPNDDTGEGD